MKEELLSQGPAGLVTEVVHQFIKVMEQNNCWIFFLKGEGVTTIMAPLLENPWCNQNNF